MSQCRDWRALHRSSIRGTDADGARWVLEGGDVIVDRGLTVIPNASNTAPGGHRVDGEMGRAHLSPFHRGFETVTYIIDGVAQHRDSLGGGGIITDGDTQWMTAAAGIVHIERPPEEFVARGGLFHGVQLWVNPPSRLKSRSPPTGRLS